MFETTNQNSCFLHKNTPSRKSFQHMKASVSRVMASSDKVAIGGEIQVDKDQQSSFLGFFSTFRFFFDFFQLLMFFRLFNFFNSCSSDSKTAP